MTAPVEASPARFAATATTREVEAVRPVLWHLTPRGIAALAVGLGLVAMGLGWRYSTLAGVGAALLLAVLMELTLVCGPIRISARREVTPLVVERHGDCTATVEVTGRLPLLVRTMVRDRVGRQRVAMAVSRAAVTYRVPTLRRGLMEVGPLTVDVAGTFGLAARTAEQGGVTHVRVLPRFVPARAPSSGRRRSAVGADESMDTGGTDLVGLHEYVPGDDLRRLHWATSARTGILMVRDDAEPATPHLSVVLDDVAQHYADHDATDTDFEDAVEVANALCRAALRENRPVHLMSTSGAIDVSVGSRVGAAEVEAQELYAALAEVQASPEPKHVRPPARALDTVAVVSGSEAPLPRLEDWASRAALGVLLIVDHTSSISPPSRGAATVLRGPRSIDLARLWDRAVA